MVYRCSHPSLIVVFKPPSPPQSDDNGMFVLPVLANAHILFQVWPGSVRSMMAVEPSSALSGLGSEVSRPHLGVPTTTAALPPRPYGCTLALS